jgi:succinate-semialdehyde dehydrogenase/glutarate-semialdehyde dehydrogenase
LLIGGDWTGAEAGETLDVTHPTTGAVIGTVPACGTVETRRAIDAAAALPLGARAPWAGTRRSSSAGMRW